MTEKIKRRPGTSPDSWYAGADRALCATVIWEQFFGNRTGFNSRPGQLLPPQWESLLNPRSALARLFQAVCYWKGFGDPSYGWKDAYSHATAAARLDGSLSPVRVMAKTHLAYFHLRGIGVDANPGKALRMLSRLVEDFGEESRLDILFLLAHCRARYSTTRKHWEAARDMLGDLANKGHYDAFTELIWCVAKHFPSSAESNALVTKVQGKFLKFLTPADSRARSSRSRFPILSSELSPASTFLAWYPFEAERWHPTNQSPDPLAELSSLVNKMLSWGGSSLNHELVAIRKGMSQTAKSFLKVSPKGRVGPRTEKVVSRQSPKTAATVVEHEALSAASFATANLSAEQLRAIASSARAELTKRLIDQIDGPATALEVLEADLSEVDVDHILRKTLHVISGYRHRSFRELQSIVSCIQRLGGNRLRMAETIGKLASGSLVYVTAEKPSSNYANGRFVAMDAADPSSSVRRIRVLPLTI